MTLLPFGGNHPASNDLLTAKVPMRLVKSVKLHRQLVECHGPVLLKQRGIAKQSMALPFEGRKLSNLFVLITCGMVAHRYSIALGWSALSTGVKRRPLVAEDLEAFPLIASGWGMLRR